MELLLNLLWLMLTVPAVLVLRGTNPQLRGVPGSRVTLSGSQADREAS